MTKSFKIIYHRTNVIQNKEANSFCQVLRQSLFIFLLKLKLNNNKTILEKKSVQKFLKNNRLYIFSFFVIRSRLTEKKFKWQFFRDD